MNNPIHNVSIFPPGRRDHWLDISVLILTIVASLIAILHDQGSVPPWPMDQSFVESADLHIQRMDGHWVFHYPKLQFSGGITSSVLVGLYKLIIPTDSGTLNWHIRTIAMVGYLGSTHLLLRAFIASPLARVAGLLLVATTGFQFIQPSSEVIAGSLFTLFVIASTKRWPVIVSSLFLAGFALCKVEFFLTTPFLTGLWWWKERKTSGRDWAIPLFVLLWTFALLLPGLVVHGFGVMLGNRSFDVFSFHYAILFHPHQYQTYGPDPWKYAPRIMEKIFPGANSVGSVILSYPKKYIDFLALSAITSFQEIIRTLKFMIIPAMFTYLHFKELRGLKFPLLLLATALVFTLLPAWLFAFIHLRYMAKLHPVIIGLSIAGCLVLQPRFPRAGQVVLWVSILGTLFWQLLLTLPYVWENSHSL
jgi:hypothetical protein